ncbi:MAG: hypothetical protein WCO03_00065 [bacterium]
MKLSLSSFLLIWSNQKERIRVKKLFGIGKGDSERDLAYIGDLSHVEMPQDLAGFFCLLDVVSSSRKAFADYRTMPGDGVVLEYGLADLEKALWKLIYLARSPSLEEYDEQVAAAGLNIEEVLAEFSQAFRIELARVLPLDDSLLTRCLE